MKKYEKQLCNNPECTNIAVKGGVCVRYGEKVKKYEKKHCRNIGYANIALRGGVCWRHGAKYLIKKYECSTKELTTNVAQKEGVCNKQRAEVKLCSFNGCTTNVRIVEGFCKLHSIAIYNLPNCTNKAQIGEESHKGIIFDDSVACLPVPPAYRRSFEGSREPSDLGASVSCQYQNAVIESPTVTPHVSSHQ